MRSDWPVAWMAVATLTPLLTLASVRLSSAQTVQGTVVDAESGVPIYTAEVALLTTDGGAASRALTDTRGRFVFGVPDSGSFRLRATRFGYVPFTTDAFELAPDQDVVAELRMQVSPVALDSLGAVVEARRPRRLERVGFFKRQAKGFGYFLTPEDIEARRPVHPSDLFWGVPGVRVSYRTLSANVRETRSTQRIRVGRRQRKRTCWDCEREWKRMVVPLEPGRPSEARQLLRTRR